MITTEQILEQESLSLVDAVYSHLIQEGLELPSWLEKLAEEYKLDSSDLAFILSGLETSYGFIDIFAATADDITLEVGEIEIEREEYKELPEAAQEDWALSDNYAYYLVGMFHIRYDKEQVEQAIADWRAE